MWAAAQLRHASPGLYYAPQLWGTSDGVIPYRRFWAEYLVMTSHRAGTQLTVASAITLAMGDASVEEARIQTRARAFPTFREA